jgi:hypothetical protein
MPTTWQKTTSMSFECWSCRATFDTQSQLDAHDEAAALRDDLRLIVLRASNLLPNGFADLGQHAKRLLNPIERSCGIRPFVADIRRELLDVTRLARQLLGNARLGPAANALLLRYDTTTTSPSSSSSQQNNITATNTATTNTAVASSSSSSSDTVSASPKKTTIIAKPTCKPLTVEQKFVQRLHNNDSTRIHCCFLLTLLYYLHCFFLSKQHSFEIGANHKRTNRVVYKCND